MQKEKTIKLLICVIAVLAAVSAVFAVLFVRERNKADINRKWQSEAISLEDASSDGYYKDEYMQQAIDNAINNEFRGPVGAVITKKNGELVVSTSNHNTEVYTLRHAELFAIEEAEKILGTRDLSDCILYTSAEPCLMCAAAIANVNIFRVYYAAGFAESEQYGFSDEKFYNEIENGGTLTDWVHVEKENSLEPFIARHHS